MASTNNDPLDFINNSPGIQSGSQADLVQLLLYEIIRVKELITYYDSIPNGGGQLGSSILNELVSEAYNSLVNYDTVLMQKYYDLLLNCDWFRGKSESRKSPEVRKTELISTFTTLPTFYIFPTTTTLITFSQPNHTALHKRTPGCIKSERFFLAFFNYIAFPVAWYAMSRWLQGFAYRTSISWWVFAIAALLAIVITITTVSFRAIKAALMNPVTSLRAE
jgi:hypothetical protein